MKEYWSLQRYGDNQVDVDKAVSTKLKKRSVYQVEKCKRNKSSDGYSKYRLFVCNIRTKAKHTKCRAMIQHKNYMLVGT